MFVLVPFLSEFLPQCFTFYLFVSVLTPPTHIPFLLASLFSLWILSLWTHVATVLIPYFEPTCVIFDPSYFIFTKNVLMTLHLSFWPPCYSFNPYYSFLSPLWPTFVSFWTLLLQFWSPIFHLNQHVSFWTPPSCLIFDPQFLILTSHISYFLTMFYFLPLIFHFDPLCYGFI